MAVPLSHSTAPMAIPDGWTLVTSRRGPRANGSNVQSVRIGKGSGYFSKRGLETLGGQMSMLVLIGDANLLGIIPCANGNPGALKIAEKSGTFSSRSIYRTLDLAETTTFDFVEKQGNVLVFKRREQAESEGQG